MLKHIIMFLVILLLALAAAAQPYGDTARARQLAIIHPLPPNYCRMQLGYIDTTEAHVTRRQFLDNMQVGMRLVGDDFPPGTVVIEYYVSWMQKGGDYHSGIQVKNSASVPQSTFRSNHFDNVKAGDKIFIEGIRVKQPDGKIRNMNSVRLTII